MKKIYLMILLCCFAITPIQAKYPPQILIVSSDLPNMYILQDDGNKQFQVRILSRNSLIPLTCLNNDLAKFNELTLNTTSLSCQMTSLNKKMNLNIQNYIRLDFKHITKDFPIQLEDYDLQDFQSTLAIFQIIGEHLNIQTILKYKDYIKTDLSLTALYDLFKQYQQKPLRTIYRYPHLVWIPNKHGYYPIEKGFYKAK